MIERKYKLKEGCEITLGNSGTSLVINGEFICGLELDISNCGYFEETQESSKAHINDLQNQFKGNSRINIADDGNVSIGSC